MLGRGPSVEKGAYSGVSGDLVKVCISPTESIELSFTGWVAQSIWFLSLIKPACMFTYNHGRLDLYLA